MTYIALALVAALVVSNIAWAQQLRATSRQHFRERDLLENKLCSLAGTPWQTPPADEPREQKPRRDFARYTTSPEQRP